MFEVEQNFRWEQFRKGLFPASIKPSDIIFDELRTIGVRQYHITLFDPGFNDGNFCKIYLNFQVVVPSNNFKLEAHRWCTVEKKESEVVFLAFLDTNPELYYEWLFLTAKKESFINN
ncbi:MAG: hypothetical protein ACRCST_13500 [Turicibacter sp.]